MTFIASLLPQSGTSLELQQTLQIAGCMFLMRMRVIRRHCDCCVYLNFGRNIGFTRKFEPMICPIAVCELKAPRWTEVACDTKSLTKNKGWRNPSLWGSRRKNDKCRMLVFRVLSLSCHLPVLPLFTYIWPVPVLYSLLDFI